MEGYILYIFQCPVSAMMYVVKKKRVLIELWNIINRCTDLLSYVSYVQGALCMKRKNRRVVFDTVDQLWSWLWV